MKHRSELSDEECAAEFQMLSKDQIEYDPPHGTSHWRDDRQPTMLVWAARIYDFLRVLEGVVGFLPARRHSYEVGSQSGRDGAEVIRRSIGGDGGDKAVPLLMLGNRILVGAGWGRSTIEYDEDAGSVVWEFPRGTAIAQAAAARGPREDPSCAFIAGFVAGWTNASLGAEVEFQEVECVALGQSRCRFESREFIRFRK